jgi:hypothetical protein
MGPRCSSAEKGDWTKFNETIAMCQFHRCMTMSTTWTRWKLLPITIPVSYHIENTVVSNHVNSDHIPSFSCLDVWTPWQTTSGVYAITVTMSAYHSVRQIMWFRCQCTQQKLQSICAVLMFDPQLKKILTFSVKDRCLFRKVSGGHVYVRAVDCASVYAIFLLVSELYGLLGIFCFSLYCSCYNYSKLKFLLEHAFINLMKISL